LRRRRYPGRRIDEEGNVPSIQFKIPQAMGLQLRAPKGDRYASATAQDFEKWIKGKIVRNVRTLDMNSPLPTAIINFTDGSSVEVVQLGVEGSVSYHPKSTYQG